MIRSVALAFALTGFAAAAPVPENKAAELLLGKWEGQGGTVTVTPGTGAPVQFERKVIVTFRKDGTMTIAEQEIEALKAMNPKLAKGETVEGTYKFVKDGEIEMAMKGVDEKVRAKVAVTAAELVLDAMGEKTTFKRMK
jgi:hypothetical protein